MSFWVEMTAQAKAEVRTVYHWIAQHSPTRAERWHAGLVRAIESLSDNPERCGIARERSRFRSEIRQLLYGKRRNVYRILFQIQGDTVHVLHVVHAAQRFLEP